VQYEIPFSGFRDTAFRNNYQRALHRWVPWIAGFSASFVDGILERLDHAPHDKITVLDPFAGVGTTLVEALKNGHNAIGFEINPYAALAANAKINCHSYQVEILEERTEKLAQFVTKQTAQESARPDSVHPEGFVSRVPFFSPAIERQVLFALDFISRETCPWVRDLFRVALGSVMVGFSNYSYEPSLGTRAAAGKADVEHADVAAVLVRKLTEIAEDIAFFQATLQKWKPRPRASVYPVSYFGAAGRVPPHSVDLLVTSPPYLNNYHYIRNTRPQMFWLGMVQSPADLKTMERSSFGQFWQTVRAGPVVPLQTQNIEVKRLLDALRERNKAKGIYGGNGWANYAATYFNDCVRFCRVTKRLMKPGGLVVIVIGNNILQGIEFPTDRLLAEIAAENGFELVAMHKVRTKRTGTSIINSSVRSGTVKKRVHLYEMALELRPRSEAAVNP